MDVVVAMIAAVASLAAAGWAIVDARLARAQGSRTEQELALFKSSLENQAAQDKARLDYEYEARKRLYTECEPLLFQLVEFSKGGIRHVQGLARSARNGDIRPDGSGWLTTNDSSEDIDEHYYFNSTMYRMVAPLTCVALLHRALTTVDLAVDSDLRRQFQITRWLNSVITDEFELALLEPKLAYDPNHPEATAKAKTKPATYQRQGLYTGRRDSAAEALIVRENGQPPRCMSFGEFEQALKQKTPVYEAFRPVARLIEGFHPQNRPVLWRVLVAQAHIYDELVRSQAAKLVVTTGEHASPAPPALDPKRFDWRLSPGAPDDEDVLVAPFDVAGTYIRHLQAR